MWHITVWIFAVDTAYNNSHRLVIPTIRSFDCCPGPKCPKKSNKNFWIIQTDTPTNTTSAQSLPVFRNRLKTHLIFPRLCCCVWEVTLSFSDTLIIFLTYLLTNQPGQKHDILDRRNNYCCQIRTPNTVQQPCNLGNWQTTLCFK